MQESVFLESGANDFSSIIGMTESQFLVHNEVEAIRRGNISILLNKYHCRIDTGSRNDQLAYSSLARILPAA